MIKSALFERWVRQKNGTGLVGVPLKATRWLSLFLFIFHTSLAQHLNYIHYNTNNSKLPHDVIFTVKQDKTGFLWIGTDDGLVRFDGTEMEIIDKGFSSRYATHVDYENGVIWACTWKGGIYHLQNDSAIAVNTLKNEEFAISTNRILVFNNLIIAQKFNRYRVYRYDPAKNLIVPISLKLKKDTIYSVYPSHNGYYHFIKTSDHRLYAYNSSGLYEVKGEALVKQNTTIVPDNIWQSADGILYARKGAFIYRTAPGFTYFRLVYTLPVSHFENKPPDQFWVLPSGNVCVGYNNPVPYDFNLTYYLITKNGSIINLSAELSKEVLSAHLAVDNEGGIWLSTDGQGLYHIFDMKHRQLGGNAVFKNSTITDMQFFRNDSLLIGTKKGLYLYSDQVVAPLKTAAPFASSVIKYFFYNWQGETAALITGSGDVEKSYLIRRRILPPPLNLRKMKRLNHYLVNLDSWSKAHVYSARDTNSPRCRIIPCLLRMDAEEDEHEKLWLLASPQELYCLDTTLAAVKYTSPKLRNVLINCLLAEKGKGLWLGTNQGLFLIRDNREPECWSVPEGLINLNIRCILKGKKGLWIGTQNGLFGFKDGVFRVFKKRDGLIADDVSCLAPLNETEIAVGSSKGLTLFDVHDHTPVPAPHLLMESLMINGQPARWDQPQEVPYNGGMALRYRCITFTYPELLVFQYRLNNDEPWVTTTNNDLVLTDLSPGRYRLELKVKKYNTVYSAPVFIALTVLAPWWQSTWFQLTVLICGLLLLYVFLYVGVLRQKKKMQTRQEIAELKMKALQAQMNPHFIANTLNVIQYYVFKQDELSVNLYLSQFTSLTRLFLEVSRSRFISLETELRLLNQYVNLEKLRFGDKFIFSIHIDPLVNTHKVLMPGLMLQPLIENSINHGVIYLPQDKTGTIDLRIEREGDFTSFILEDNGIGRAMAGEMKRRMAGVHRSFSGQILEDLKNVYNSMPGCEITISVVDKESAAGEALGTIVTLRIKMNETLFKQNFNSTEV